MMMRTAIAAALLVCSAPHVTAADEWITLESAGSVADTSNKLVAAIERAGARVFAMVDHAAGAKSIGTDLEPTVLVIFGNPKIGTPIIKADRRAGLDLPLHVLIWEDGGTVKIGYENPKTLKARYNIQGADDSFAAMNSALQKLTKAAAE